MEINLTTASPTPELTAKRPVLAILTMDDAALQFRGNRGNFSDLIHTGQDMGYIVYVLTVKNLKLTRKMLYGYLPKDKSNVWEKKLFPFPDLIYNRIPQREDELQPDVQRKLAACMEHPRIKGLFNPSFFNKWQLFEWLKQSKVTKPYVPSTRRLISQGGLDRMIRKHPYLYLKPVSGKAGKGIMTLRLQPDKPLPYRLKIQESRKSSTFNCSSLGKLWSRIQQESNGEAYIAQQGIQLASYHERQFDLRALLQKNGSGHWDLTGIGARVAGSLSITTHVPRGGTIEEPEKLINHFFGPDKAGAMLRRARTTAIVLARQIERGSGYLLGEMSMDLGIDHEGNLWFFEANAKPMKFDEPHIRRKSLERIFQYGSYLIRKKQE
ncbi:YheC/YheD family protein [Paenibacillus beijingensis]|uniref:Endospore coat-associated protein n=1 Tax=Paenibacillus beijingensis TaxID=1126833 RepID=A0A0D5NLU1_9BACL|nr:YheC/YheD family protein [Paenibacillus beijingensis]AJY75977.1 endospore coat-associated protein [Paenibacillus beijingensis]